MELLENRLNSNNSIVVSQVISSVVKNILKKDPSAVENAPELKFLVDKCINDDTLISEAACSGILLLLEQKVLQVESVLQDFITRISTTKCYSGLTHLLGRLLYLELKSNVRKEKTVCQYNLKFPQHPFVTLLHEHSNSWEAVLNEIHFFYDINDDSIQIYRDRLFQPIYLYTICNPSESTLNYCKEKLWKFILDSHSTVDILKYLLCWLPLQSKSNIVLVSDLLTEALSVVNDNDMLKTLILWQISALHYLILYKSNPRQTIRCLEKFIGSDHLDEIADCMLYMLTRSVTICSSIFLNDFLLFCFKLISNHKCDIFSLGSLKSSIIHIIANESLLTENAVKVAKDIYTHIENNKFGNVQDNVFYNTQGCIFKSNADVYTSINLHILSKKLTSKNKIIEFLSCLESSPQFFIKSIIHFLYGIFLQNNPPHVEHHLLEMLIKTSQTYIETTPETLTVILYKLSKTTNPKLHLELLQSLPKMLVLKDNYQKIVATVLALSNGPCRLQNLSALLMFEIWKIEDRAYTSLENILMMNCQPTEEILEFYTTRTYILKEICELSPEKYGKEIVAHFSNILNKHSAGDGALPCSLAIDGITALCKAEIIDAITTWANLSPKFADDIRPPIIISLCNLIHEMASLSYTDAYPELVNEVVAKLWHYVSLTDDPNIIKAALNGLTAFTLEQISMNMPDKFLGPDMLEIRQNSVVGTPHTVTGGTWIYFLKSVNEKIVPLVVDFLIKMVSIEISNYLKYVYQVKGNSEPLHFSNLPSHSIVRGIGEFLKHWLSKWKDHNTEKIYVACLKIFSQEYSKPLPPFNWHFLLELIGDLSVRPYCIDIASHQVILSGSARQIIENLVEGCTVSKDENDIIGIYKNLKYLANSLQPITLKPFFSASFKMGLNNYVDGDSKVLDAAMNGMKMVLSNKDIQDINKSTIGEVMVDLLYGEDVHSKFFEILLDFVHLLPSKLIEKITHSSQCGEVTQIWFEKSLAIRCRIAESTSQAPMDYLEDILDVVCHNKLYSVTSLTFIHFLRVFKNQVENTDCALWLLDLIGKIQSKVANHSDVNYLVYLFDVFMLSVVVFSGYFTFIDDMDKLNENLVDVFPQAFASLLLIDHWSICTNQALEWLYYVNSEENIPIKYRQIFGTTLQALKGQNEFTKNFKWMKYYNCELFF